MAWVVLLRAANVGGHQVFRPKLVASSLAEHGVTSVGAAGTFVVNAPAGSVNDVEAAFRAALPIDPQLVMVPGSAVKKLVKDTHDTPPPDPSAKPYVAALMCPPTLNPTLPQDDAHGRAGEPWQVRTLGYRDQLAFMWRRPTVARQQLYPNAVAEELFGVPCTTRTLGTLLKVAAQLDDHAREPP